MTVTICLTQNCNKKPQQTTTIFAKKINNIIIYYYNNIFRCENVLRIT